LEETRNDQQTLVVRRSTRYEVAWQGEMSVSRQHAALIRFGPSCGGRDGWVSADIVDFGSGGVGISSPVFVPRRALVRLRMADPSGGSGDGGVLEADLRVQRVTMTDRRPTYLLGTAFAEPPPELVRQIEAMAARLAQSGATVKKC
jgi:hypothetical protein